MTRDEIIRLGRESQRECFSDGGHWFSMEVRDLERFAALAAEQPKPEPVAKVELMTTGGNAGLATRIVEIDDPLRDRLSPGQFLYVAPPDTEALRRENERLRSELVEAEAVRERCNERAFRLESENERLRDELRQSSIDITRAEVERLREALEIIAGYRPCIDSLMGNQDIAIAALRREGT